MSRRLVRIVLPAVLIAACLAPASAGAAVVSPDIFTDEFNGDADCSLREAVQATNTNVTVGSCVHDGSTGADTINLGAGTYVLDLAGAGEDSNLTGDLDALPAAGGLTIDGAGAASTIIDTDTSPAWDDRVLTALGAGGTLTLSDMTITGGDAGDAFAGGGVRAVSTGLALQRVRVTDNASDSGGGGVGVVGPAPDFTVEDSTIDGNSAGGSPADGGGVMALSVATVTIESSVIRENTITSSSSPQGGGLGLGSADLALTDSVVSDNHAVDTGVAGIPRGGGVNLAGGTADIYSSAIVGNEVTGGAIRRGGGLASSGTTAIVNSTFSGNEALGSGGDGGGFHNDADALIFASTFGPNPTGSSAATAILHNGTSLLIAGSVVEGTGTGTACSGSPGSAGFNVFTDTSCGTPLGSDEADADPMLGPLADLGGPDVGAPGFTQPLVGHAPAATSTAVDHVPAADCDEVGGNPLTGDQLGNLRPKDGDDPDAVADCEAGSIEIAATPPPPPPPGGSGGGATTPAAPKKCKKGQKLKKGKCVKKKRKRR